MKLKLDFETLITFIFVIFGILLIVSLYYESNSDFLRPEGTKFCQDQGYEKASFLGSYSERQGKVECVACYKQECEYEEFNVIKKFGIIREAKG